ncbi:MAG: PAS domain S-box protein [Rubrivivax sp.]|nr:MAG: PAS domain S-box protein [Rubrivivax sp.]
MPSSRPLEPLALTRIPGDVVVRQVRDHAMFLMDRRGRIATWNEGVGQVLGWEEKDWIGQSVEVVFTPEDVAAGVPDLEFRQAEREGRADDSRWMLKRGGARFYCNGSVTPIRGSDGTVVAFVKVMHDGTSLRLAAEEYQRALAAEREEHAKAEREAAKLRAIIDAIPDALYVGNAEGITECNAKALALLGAASLADLQLRIRELGERFRVRYERDGPLVEPDRLPFARALKGEIAMLETWATRPTGEDVLIRGTAAPIRVDNEIVGAIAINSDLTYRVELEEQRRAISKMASRLRARDEEFRALVSGVRDYAIFTVDVEGRISSWHVGAQLMKGYTAEEAIGMPFAQLFTPEDRERGRPQHEMDVAASTGEYKGEGTRLRKNGVPFVAEVVLTALRGPRGDLLGYLKLTQDITDRKNVEAERDQTLRNAESARVAAEQASRAKDEFVATVSHELRTPLSAILGWAQVLQRRVPEPALMKHAIDAIARNAAMQARLVEDLLDVSRIESGQLRLELQPTDPAAIAQAAVDAILPAATAKRIAVALEADAEAGWLMADAARLQQVVLNLLNNAVKFTPDDGRIDVTVRREADIVEIAVADNGQGMEPAFIEQAFERFRQQDSSMTRRHGGLGLGLSIVRELTHLHGGTVKARSAGAGQGSTFVLCLPALAPQRERRARPTSTHEGVDTLQNDDRLIGFSLLLVDDEPDGRGAAAYALRVAGAEVTEAGSAEEALAEFRARRPHAILSDIGMPIVDGYDFIRLVREIDQAAGRHTPAAAFSAFARAEDRQRAIDAGFEMHLAKPLDPVALVEGVVALLRSNVGDTTGELRSP